MKINFASKAIEITKTFANKASHFGSEEYHALRTAMCDLPDFEVAINVAIVSAQKMLVGNMDTWRDSTAKGTIDMWAAASGIDIYGDMSTEQRAANLIKVYDILVAKRKELIDSGQTDTIGYTNIDAAISLLTPNINQLRSAQEALTTATSRYNDVVNPTADAIDGVASSAEDVAENGASADRTGWSAEVREAFVPG